MHEIQTTFQFTAKIAFATLTLLSLLTHACEHYFSLHNTREWLPSICYPTFRFTGERIKHTRREDWRLLSANFGGAGLVGGKENRNLWWWAEWLGNFCCDFKFAFDFPSLILFFSVQKCFLSPLRVPRNHIITIWECLSDLALDPLSKPMWFAYGLIADLSSVPWERFLSLIIITG